MSNLRCMTIAAAATLLAACSSIPPTNYVDDYRAALQATESAKAPLPDGSRGAMLRFASVFANYTKQNVRDQVPEIYADDAYFNDTLTQLRGADQISDYLAYGVDQFDQISFKPLSASEDGADYYFRWEFLLRDKDINDGQPFASIGMSHIRFNEAGKVILHQDFWDSAHGLYQYLPVVGSIVRRVDRRIERSAEEGMREEAAVR